VTFQLGLAKITKLSVTLNSKMISVQARRQKGEKIHKEPQNLYMLTCGYSLGYKRENDE
jgi:hypothetical protein